MSATATKPSLVGRVLRLVTDVRDEEVPLALTLSLNVFLLLTAYYVIKPVREALILALASGAEYKSYMSAALALALLVAVPAYGKLVDRLPRLELVVGVTLFFASHLLFFYFASQRAALRPSLGDVSSALLVLVGSQAFGWSVREFALANALLALVWLGLGAGILAEHRRLVPAEAPKPRLARAFLSAPSQSARA